MDVYLLIANGGDGKKNRNHVSKQKMKLRVLSQITVTGLQQRQFHSQRVLYRQNKNPNHAADKVSKTNILYFTGVGLNV
jgi:hypothetical protein